MKEKIKKNMQKDLNKYLSNVPEIAKDFNELSYKDLVRILQLNQQKAKGVTYGAAVDFVTKLIEIKNREKLLRVNRKLVVATWVLATATIIINLLVFWLQYRALMCS